MYETVKVSIPQTKNVIMATYFAYFFPSLIMISRQKVLGATSEFISEKI